MGENSLAVRRELAWAAYRVAMRYGVADCVNATAVGSLVGPLEQRHAGAGDSHLRASLWLAFFYVRWCAIGFPTFVLSEALTAALLLTDVRGIRAAEWRPPLPQFSVELPRGMIQIAGEDVEVLSFNSGLAYSGDLRGRDIEALLLDGGPPSLVRKTVAGPTVEFADLNVMTATGTMYTQQFAGPEFISELLGGFSELGDPAKDAGLRICARLMLNLVLYIAEHRDLVPPALPRHTSAKSRPKEITIRLGSKIRLPAPMIAAAVAATKSSPNWRLQTRFVVRGHWRKQACGSNRSERRRIWIKIARSLERK